MSLQDFKDFFSAHYDQLVSMAKSHFPPTHYNRDQREELTAVTMAICWRWAVAHYVQGGITEDNAWRWIKNHLFYAVKQARSGRDLPREDGHRGEGSPVADIMSRKVRRNRVRISEVAIYFCSDDTPIPDQVSFRIDFPAFLDTLSERQRLIIGELMRGTAQSEIAHIFGISTARISQMKREFKELMDRFYGE